MFDFLKKKPKQIRYEDYWERPENMQLCYKSASGQGGSHAGLAVKYIPKLKQVVAKQFVYDPKSGNHITFEHMDIKKSSPSRQELLEIIRPVHPFWVP